MQFDVYRNKNSATQKRFPYLLDVQADLLNSLETRVVIPLTPEKSSKDTVLASLTPIVPIAGDNYIAVTPQMAGMLKRELGAPVENLAEFRVELIGALDMLFTGV